MPLPAAALGALISGGFGLASGGLSGLFSGSAQDRANSYNLKIAQMNNKTQQQIAQDMIDTQISMQRENNDFNAHEAALAHLRQLQQMDYQAELNSPAAMALRYRLAGINPYVALAGGNGQSLASAGSSPMASSGGSISPVMPSFTSPVMQPVPSVAGGAFEGLMRAAEALKNVGDFGLSQSNVNRINKLLNEEFRDLQLKNDFQETFAPWLAKTKIANDLAEIGLKGQQAVLAAEQGKTEESERLLKQAQAAAAKAQEKLNDEQARLFKAQAETWDEKVRSEIKFNNAKAGEAGANTNKLNEEADSQRFDNMQTWDAMQQGINKYVDEHYDVHADILLKRENRALAHQFINKAVAETVGHELSNQEQAMINRATPELLAHNIELVRSQWRKNESDINKNSYEMQREAVQMTIQGLVGMIIGLKGFGGNFHIKGFAQ